MCHDWSGGAGRHHNWSCHTEYEQRWWGTGNLHPLSPCPEIQLCITSKTPPRGGSVGGKAGITSGVLPVSVLWLSQPGKGHWTSPEPNVAAAARKRDIKGNFCFLSSKGKIPPCFSTEDVWARRWAATKDKLLLLSPDGSGLWLTMPAHAEESSREICGSTSSEMLSEGAVTFWPWGVGGGSSGGGTSFNKNNNI